MSGFLSRFDFTGGVILFGKHVENSRVWSVYELTEDQYTRNSVSFKTFG